MTSLGVVEIGSDRAGDVLAVIRRAFEVRPALDPPSTALDETLDSVAAALGAAGGLLVLLDDEPVGTVLFDASRARRLGLRRVSVDPAHRCHGVASAMVGVAEDVAAARSLGGIWLTAREELPDTVDFWVRRDYVEVGRAGRSIELAKALMLTRSLPTPRDTRSFGGLLARELRAGDLVVLSGGVGAGKTTLAQGIGAALRVRGDITSPTFVISRIHPSLVGGPDLVHVDAYRLAGAAELDDLDLDASLPEAVTVVEWGEGMAEGLGDSWLHVRLDPSPEDGPVQCDDDGCLTRVVSVRPHGPRWAAMPLRSVLAG